VADAIVDIDTDLCPGSGYCERSLPEVFRMIARDRLAHDAGLHACHVRHLAVR
jgi:ferredoxin